MIITLKAPPVVPPLFPDVSVQEAHKVSKLQHQRTPIHTDSDSVKFCFLGFKVHVYGLDSKCFSGLVINHFLKISIKIYDDWTNRWWVKVIFLPAQRRRFFWLTAAVFSNRSCSFMIETCISVLQRCKHNLMLMQSHHCLHYLLFTMQLTLTKIHPFTSSCTRCEHFKSVGLMVWQAWPFQTCIFEP